MRLRHHGSVRRDLRSPVAPVVIAALAFAGLSACSSNAEPSAEAAEAAVAATEPAPATTSPTVTTTTLPPVATPPTTAGTTTTSTTTTTTLFAPPPEQPDEPIHPPADVYGSEPIIEMGYIEIPKVDLWSPMYQGIRLTTLDRGPGHWPGTALPGQDGNAVVSAHRTSHGGQFRYIDRLEPGDEILFHTFDGTHVYHVTETEIVGPDALWIVDQTEHGTATLFACHPPGSTRQRIVVRAELVDA